MRHFAILALAGLTALASCKKDDPEDPQIPNEEEVITTLIYELTSANDTATFIFRDLDGDGGNDPEITLDTLLLNENYMGKITLLNELETPAEDITEEVEEEALEHQFFYLSDTTSLMVMYDDMDAEGNPIGIQTMTHGHMAGSSALTIILRHEPNKNASGVADGDITNAGGETDIEVTFDVHVQ